MPGTELTARQVAELPLGMHRVAKNLYLRNLLPSASSWVFVYDSRVTSRRREMGLGSYPDVTAVSAKAQALRLRLDLIAGDDPLDIRQAAQIAARAARKPARGLIFKAVSDLYIKAHAPKWRNAKQAAQWESSLAAYALPVMGELPIEAVTTGHVMEVLEPIWHTKPETASRVRGRIEAVIDYASARHWRSGDNPARWKGHIQALLPARDQVMPVKHFTAMAPGELPGLWEKLTGNVSSSTLSLSFCALTATRTGETIGLQRSELDLAARVWVIPASRSKSGRPHRVPLSDQAMAVLEAAEQRRTSIYQFSGARHGQPLSNMAMLEWLRGAYPGRKLTVHGFRSTFRDWCAENGIARELAEAALAHSVKDATEAAYLRSDMCERRRPLMQAWADFLTSSNAADNVLPMRVGSGS